MKLLDKTLCDMTQSEIEKHQKKIKKIIKNPKYFCKKCFRASSEKQYLCKASKIK